MKKIITVIMIVVSLQTHAISLSEISDKVKPLIEKVFGADIANKIFGDTGAETLALPEVPKISKDTKSLDVYNQKSDEKIFDDKKMEEYNIAYVQELVGAVREVPANRDDIGKWYNTLYQGATREGIYRALVLDEYYRRLENYPDEASGAVKGFTIEFMDKFIGKKVTEEKLAGINLYSMKRIVVEDALDIADMYILGNKKEDFYTWYAVLSAELATKYPIWENRLRASSNAKQHLGWAKKMPLQFVKSELILKLHLVYNNLQKRND